MKTLNRFEQVKFARRLISAFFWALLAILACWGISATAQENSAQDATTPTAKAEQGVATNLPPSRPLSHGVGEILKMADAGVSTGVIKSYIECSPIPYQPTDEDVIALKKHNVADEVVTLLLNRGAQVRAALAQARNDAFTRALTSKRMASGGLDPESYDYFQYYYLHPRALASAYERLAPYSFSPFPYPYAYPGAPFSIGRAYTLRP